jgi:outer membrane lipoprotein SlyB
MTNNKNDHVVIALFDNENFANYGIDLLKKWDNANDEVKLGAIGVITKKGDKVKTHVPRKGGGGAKVGAVVGLIAAVLTGGTSWIVGAMGGSALGGITGAFFKKSLHLTKQEIEELGAHLDAGKVAVVVTCDEHEIEETSKHLYQYGGVVNNYTVPDEALTEAADALAATETELSPDVAVEELEELTADPTLDAAAAQPADVTAQPDAMSSEAVSSEAVSPEAMSEEVIDTPTVAEDKAP